MLLVSYLLLLLYYLVAGYGVLTLFRLRLKAAYMITLSMLLGVAVASVVPFLLQLVFIPLTPAAVFGALILVALALNIPSIRRIRREGTEDLLDLSRGAEGGAVEEADDAEHDECGADRGGVETSWAGSVHRRRL